ncbi:hypothetical protein AGR1B_pAt30188 [Agrobacterium fabacearum S56]|uniref:hypothetical protein n=1 Tax=Agrobacterium tumefaciens TaxID=358 RepID=UPI0009C8F02A|nr:hypothetical protein [Agrobacterium tumefaciens]NSY93466.1 hypothetical protein [Agrobacterium tumefaciens]CUX05609.1 hypothetical protein AGR1B_pAt30188 [Agrobacterium fabacearum S56]
MTPFIYQQMLAPVAICGIDLTIPVQFFAVMLQVLSTGVPSKSPAGQAYRSARWVSARVSPALLQAFFKSRFAGGAGFLINMLIGVSRSLFVISHYVLIGLYPVCTYKCGECVVIESAPTIHD